MFAAAPGKWTGAARARGCVGGRVLKLTNPILSKQITQGLPEGSGFQVYGFGFGLAFTGSRCNECTMSCRGIEAAQYASTSDSTVGASSVEAAAYASTSDAVAGTSCAEALIMLGPCQGSGLRRGVGSTGKISLCFLAGSYGPGLKTRLR